jgi:hypothetical protein
MTKFSELTLRESLRTLQLFSLRGSGRNSLTHTQKSREVDVAQIISREFKHVALGGVAGPETRLAFPGFIMGLLKHHEVEVSEPFTEELVSPIDDRYIRGYIKKKAIKPSASSSSVPPPIPPLENDPHQDFPEHDVPQQDAPQQPGALTSPLFILLWISRYREI